MMKNLLFVIWMLGFPLVVEMIEHEEHYARALAGSAETSSILVAIVLMLITVWVFVGCALYEGRLSESSDKSKEDWV